MMASVNLSGRPRARAPQDRAGPETGPRWREFYGLKAESQRFLPACDVAEQHRVRMVKRVLGRRPESALDAGCGDGYWCHVLKDELKVGRVEGVDLAATHVARARELFPAVPFFEGDVYALPYGDATFDVVTAVEVLEHLEEPGRALAELARVAARRVVVTVPYNEPPDARLCPHCLKTFALDGHIQRFDRRRLAALAEDAGLTPARFLVYRPWEERRPIRKLYSPLKRVLFPDEFRSGGWLAMAADKPAALKGRGR